MALVICCSCGHPLDCDNIELVVSLTCPSCRRELTLETEHGGGAPRRAILTVLEGPYWVGERFLLPVGEDLQVGSASGNWLSLESEDISDVHCRIRWNPSGDVILEDQGSKSGTWIADKRIARGRLAPQRSFRVGEFRFRLDYAAAGGTSVLGAEHLQFRREQALPQMSAARQATKPTGWLVANRFRLARVTVFATALLMGVYHFCKLAPESELGIPRAVLAGAAILASFVITGRYVALIYPKLRYLPTGVLVLLGAFDIGVVWLPLPVGICAGLLASLPLAITRVPHLVLVTLSAVFVTIFLAIMTVATGVAVSEYAAIASAAN